MTVKDAKACKDCHFLHKKETCPACQGHEFTRDWAGYVHVIDPSRSRIAEEMGITHPGPYALKVR